MFKLLIVVMLLIVVALIGGAYLHFDPSWSILAILGFGVFMVGRIGGPTVPPGSKPTHWGSGHGIYFDPDNVWVSGSDSEDVGGSNHD